MSADGRELRWGDGRGRSLRLKGRLVLADVDSVLVGRKTPTARSGSTAADNALTFSLVTAERSVDLRAYNAPDLDGWVRGLRHLVALAAQQERSSGLGFSFDQGLPPSPKIGSPGVAFPLFGKPHERRARGDDYRADRGRAAAKPARGTVAHSSEPPAEPSPYAAMAELGAGGRTRPASSAKGPAAAAAGAGGRGAQPASTSAPSQHRLEDSPYAQKLAQPYLHPPPGGGGRKPGEVPPPQSIRTVGAEEPSVVSVTVHPESTRRGAVEPPSVMEAFDSAFTALTHQVGKPDAAVDVGPGGAHTMQMPPTAVPIAHVPVDPSGKERERLHEEDDTHVSIPVASSIVMVPAPAPQRAEVDLGNALHSSPKRGSRKPGQGQVVPVVPKLPTGPESPFKGTPRDAGTSTPAPFPPEAPVCDTGRWPDEEELSEMFSRARHGRHKGLESFFLQGVTARVINAAGNTLLHTAAQNNHKKVAKVVLRHTDYAIDPPRADFINSQNGNGHTPLHFCYAYGYAGLGDYLA